MCRFLIFLPFFSFSQNIELPPPITYNVFQNNVIGLPTQIIEVKDNVISVFNVSANGFKEITPTKIIEVKEDKTIQVFNVDKNGVKEIIQTQTIKPNNNEQQYNFNRFDIFVGTN